MTSDFNAQQGFLGAHNEAVHEPRTGPGGAVECNCGDSWSPPVTQPGPEPDDSNWAGKGFTRPYTEHQAEAG